MKRIFVMVLAGAMLLSACGGGMTSEEGGEGVEAHDFWIRTGMQDGNSAAYMLLHNHTDQDVALIGASSDVATAVEIHLSSMSADGTMQMAQQESIAIPAGEELELKPGSYHVMFIGLTKDLVAGDEVTLTLHFDGYDDVTLTVPVKDAADMGGSGMDGHNMP
jgi:copper(I)-binding protein